MSTKSVLDFTTTYYFRNSLLSESLSLQMYNRDVKQVEVLLSQQEHMLSKAESATNLEQVCVCLREREGLMVRKDERVMKRESERESDKKRGL